MHNHLGSPKQETYEISQRAREISQRAREISQRASEISNPQRTEQQRNVTYSPDGDAESVNTPPITMTTVGLACVLSKPVSAVAAGEERTVGVRFDVNCQQLLYPLVSSRN